MTDAATVSHLRPPLPPQVFGSLAEPMAHAIIRRIREAVPAYSGDGDGDPCPPLALAARAGVRAFFCSGRARESEHRKVDELYRRLGFREAQCGNSPDPLLDALRVAVRCAWEHLADFAVSQQYSSATLRDIASSLLAHIDHLREQLLEGYELGYRFTHQGREAARTRLLELFARSTDERAPLAMDRDELRQLAEEAEWPLPENVVALAVTFHGDPPSPPEGDEILSRVEANRVVVLGPEDDADDLVAHFERSGPDRRVAVSWPVPLDESASALRWTARALDLVDLGVIAPTRVVRCTDHVTQLWLSAEPTMRERLCQELLAPLLAETPNSREIFSDTLLVWLETRDSAPAIAARLGVHPQTVRYRWRRIYELFGDSLRDPEFVLLVTMVLKTTVPMWKAGNESDLERFRETEPTDP